MHETIGEHGTIVTQSPHQYNKSKTRRKQSPGNRKEELVTSFICTKLDKGILISLSLAEWTHQIIVGTGGSWKLRDKQRTQRVMTH